MTTSARGPARVSSPERAAIYTRVRAELRAEHNRLTERQIDLIADVAVELRVVRIALGVDEAPAEERA